MKRSVIFLLLIVLGLSLSAQRYLIGAGDVSYIDESRDNRLVHAQAFFPADSTGGLAQGAFPVLMFAHGQQIPFHEYDYLWHNLVGNGYIIIIPTTEMGVAYDIDAMASDMLGLWGYLQDTSHAVGREFSASLSGLLGLMGHGLGGSAAILAAAQQPEGLRSLITLSAIFTNDLLLQAAQEVQVPYLSIGTTSTCIADAENHQLPLLAAAGSSYKAWLELKKGTFCQFGRSFENTPCRDRESDMCPLMPTTINRIQQQTLTLLGTFPYMEFLLRSKCDHWQFYHNFVINPSTHNFQEWGIQPSPEAKFTLEQQGSVIWLSDQSRSSLKHHWDFGNGETSDSLSPTYIYPRVDTYTIQLTVEALNGCQDSMQRQVLNLKAVDLLGFRAESVDKRIVLDWETGTESQNEYFVIERSSNGIHFHDFAKISGELRSTRPKSYNFSDNSLPSGIYYYRLRQETTYDSLTYSEVIQVKHDVSTSLFITDFWADIDQGILLLGVHAEEPGLTHIRLLSPHGVMIYHDAIEAQPGRNGLAFSTANIKPGLYIISASQKQEKSHRMILIR